MPPNTSIDLDGLIPEREGSVQVADGGYVWISEGRPVLPKPADLRKLPPALAGHAFRRAETLRRRVESGDQLSGPYLVARHDLEQVPKAWQIRSTVDDPYLLDEFINLAERAWASGAPKLGTRRHAMKAIGGFAHRWGLLGAIWLPVRLPDGRTLIGESLDDWRREIDALGALQRARLDLALPEQEQSRRRLLAMLHEGECEHNEACSRRPASTFVYRELDAIDTQAVTFHFGSYAVRVHGASTGMLSVRDNLLSVAQRCVAYAVSQRLESEIEYAVTPRPRLRFAWQPRNLLAGLYLQFAARFVGAPARVRICPQCGRPFEPRRSDQKYDRKACRDNASYHQTGWKRRGRRTP